MFAISQISSPKIKKFQNICIRTDKTLRRGKSQEQMFVICYAKGSMSSKGLLLVLSFALVPYIIPYFRYLYSTQQSYLQDRRL